MEKLVELKNITKVFPVEKGMFLAQGSVLAVDRVSFQIDAGEIVSLVGESGSGKSTIGKMIQGLLSPTEGEIFFEGKNMNELLRVERAHLVQTIFQDPFQSLNPKLSVGFMLKEALKHSSQRFHPHPSPLPDKSGQAPEGEGTEEEVEKLLEATGLPKGILNDYPHQFSGGQKQRIGIARSLAMKPKLIVADEPVSALDLTIQAQILNLLIDINHRYGISILLITHDLAVVEYCSKRLLVLERGRIVEEGLVENIFRNPKEIYTQTLLSSMLTIDI